MITPENKMIMCMKVSAINLELTSYAEQNELFELFEGFLMSLNYPVQVTNVSMPVDLKGYIADQEMKLRQEKNEHKRRLLQSYIKYSKDIESSQDIMQRQRYIIFSEDMKEDTPDARTEKMLELYEKRDEIKTALSEMNLIAEEIDDLEIIKYLHTMFDYQGALNRPIESAVIPQFIHGGKRK